MGLITTSLFLQIAMQWATVCKEFATVERKLQSYGYPPRAGLKLKFLTFIFLVGGIGAVSENHTTQ